MYRLTVRDEFSAAHALRGYGGPCEGLHGHNWGVELTVAARELDDAGMGVDFHALKKELRSELDRLDHRYLNELEPFDAINPSSENIARELFNRLAARLDSDHVEIVEVAVWESASARAAYSKP